MKITLKELLDMKPIIEKLIQKDIDVLVAYDLTKVVSAVSKELEIYSASREKVFAKFGEEDKEQKQRIVPKDKIVEFKKQINKLLDKEVKLEVPKIKLTKLAGIKMTTADLIIMDRLIEK